MSVVPGPGWAGPWPRRALVIGYGLSGRAATSWLARQGAQVSIVEDDRRRADAALAAIAKVPGANLEVAPTRGRAAELGRGTELVVPSPGVPTTHPAVAAAVAAGVPVAGEVELAWWLIEAERAAAGLSGSSDRTDRTDRGGALVAVTGTNGKTTVTELVAAMLSASGVPASAVGNVGVPVIEAAEHWGPDSGHVLVVEVSSFQLHYTRRFAPDVSCWLNFAPDHLDWHPSLEDYRSAKARIWAHQRPGSTAVVNSGDPVVAEEAAHVPPGVRTVRFGPPGTGAEWAVGHDRVDGPEGFVINAAELPRAFPHDLANVAAAAAVALAAGAAPQGCREAARAGELPPHRVQLVGERGGVAFYDDSKATTPAAVLAAVAGLASVVLVAGGRNKGLDLSVLAGAVPPVRAVVAIGEAAAEVSKAFDGRVPARTAASMAEAVALAAGLAHPGDAVLLSPGCASFDWYSSYAQRGDDFSSLVKQLLAGGDVPAGAAPPGPAPGAPAHPTTDGEAAAP